MSESLKDFLVEAFKKESDDSFSLGAQCAFEALEPTLKDWRGQLLIRIAPRWFIAQIGKSLAASTVPNPSSIAAELETSAPCT